MIPGKIGFIGLGLIGGTLAKTIRRIYPETVLTAFDSNRDTLEQAKADGILSQACDRIDDSFSGCSYIFLCAPVNKNALLLEQVKAYAGRDCILTDVGSVKASIHKKINELDLAPFFIGGHPMAGSEKNGYEHATAYLFENAYYVISPTEAVPQAKITEFTEFIHSLGSIPLILPPASHDYITGAISHLPHILASSLVNVIKRLDNKAETMKAVAAGGFKDITRIASSSPVMWQEICMANRTQIIKLLNIFIASLEDIKSQISEQEETAILDFFQSAKEYRDSISILAKGPLPVIYELYCDLIDEAGGIAALAAILAGNHISIKNIGIIHNREFQNGVLRIEFYEEGACQRSVLLLRKYHYKVYER